ncbi:Gfo/Idh/MocA family protein [Marinicrinis lubricantis]|uniref:Gfo/Idh/MocA family protein n=1 Tax=Marinicrinis lubricantis TaxID=2086470 RepID=A0ABW1IRD7_9BACL
MKKWNFGLIGCGSIGDFHMQAIHELDHAELVMVCARKQERAQEVGSRERCDWTTDIDELLVRPDVDIVTVTTSSGSHAEIGMKVLEAGKHLMVEKPMAMNAEDAERMIRMAEQKGLTIAVVSQRRFEPQHMAAYEAVISGKLGKLLMIEASCPFYRDQSYYDSAAWRGTIDQDGGAMMNQGIHSLDLMLWVSGSAVRTVYGKTATRTHQMEAEDIGAALLQFENGTLGSFKASTSIVPGFPPALTVYGEHGTVKVEGASITHWSVPGMPEPQLSSESGAGGGVSDPKSISTEYHRLQIADMLDALSDGREPMITGRDGAAAVRVIEAIYRSSKEGKEIIL